MRPDMINAFFEGFGSMMALMNVLALLKSKKVEGVRIMPTAFWMAWGLWNLWYYPSMNQPLSFYGGLGVVLANAVWVLLALHYSMPLGTRSVLYGYHQFLIHPALVAVAWIRIYGWTWDWRRWASFFAHDIGYVLKPNMDGPEGETHPLIGGQIMFYLTGDMEWFFDAVFHSRTYARAFDRPISQLCYADKLAFLMYPTWLLKALYGLSGEFEEYRSRRYAGGAKDLCEPMTFDEWHAQARVSNKTTLIEAGFSNLKELK